MSMTKSRETQNEWNARLLQQAFKGRMVRPRPGAGLIVALFITVGVMMLLPLLYLLLIAALGVGVVVYALVAASLMNRIGGGLLVHFALFFGPIMACLITIFFMLKPLFAPRLPPPPTREVLPEEEPLLFQFLYAVCHSLGAPCPSRVEIELQCNASASFRRGVFSFLRDDLVLSIGLPLVGNASIQEFASVVGHEFGHFTQRTSMRLDFIITRINLWFARVVYERDAWDARLDWGGDNPGCLVAVTTLTAHVAIYLSRRVLWCLMHAGAIVSSYTSRQMEYHADACAARFAGSDAFIRMMQRSSVLAHADLIAGEYMTTCLRKRGQLDVKVPSNYVKVVAKFAEEIMEKTGGRGTVAPRKAGIFDSHPSETARIDHVRALNEPAVFHLNGPASTLFRDFDQLAKRMSKERALEVIPYL